MKRLVAVIRSDRASGTAHVAFLTRLPVAGAVKTRLAVSLGEDGATALHRELARSCFQAVLPLAATGEVRLAVHHAGGTARQIERWLVGSGAPPQKVRFVHREVRFVLQPEGDLGHRIAAAFKAAWARGASTAVVIGSDCPDCDAAVVRDALSRLHDHDGVIGPARDGGYYLLGLQTGVADSLSLLLEDVAWGSPDVLAQTLHRAEALGLRIALLGTLADVDRPDDLPTWERTRQRGRVGPDATVSVVVPTLDEAGGVSAAVEAALSAGATEVIVADGGSTDDTRECARRAGARVVDAPRGRAAQMNAGAAVATGDLLAFVHADTLLPVGGGDAIRRALDGPGVVAGAFAFASRESDPRSRMIGAGGRLRVRLTHHPYGDQGLFMTVATFRRLGGFPDLPVMEDWELVRRVRRLGHFTVLDERASTSTRVFRTHGLARTLLVNYAVVLGYLLGVNPLRLARWRLRIVARDAGALGNTTVETDRRKDE